MTSKIKFFFLCLVLITAFSVYSFFSSQSLGSLEAGIRTTILPAGTIQDTDNDGLNDTDESVWNTDFQKADTDGDGFLDGEEVASGHDPLIPGPGDSIINKNLTEQASNLLLGGFLSNDLQPAESNAEQSNAFNVGIQEIALGVIHDYYQASIETPALKGDPNVDESEYLDRLAQVIQDTLINPTVSIPNSQNIEEYLSFFTQQTTQLKRAHDAVLAIPPPPAWVSIHSRVLAVLKDMQSDYQSIGQLKTDPVRAAIAVHDLQVVVPTTVRQLFKDITDLTANRKLAPTGNFYRILSLIYP